MKIDDLKNDFLRQIVNMITDINRAGLCYDVSYSLHLTDFPSMLKRFDYNKESGHIYFEDFSLNIKCNSEALDFRWCLSRDCMQFIADDGIFHNYTKRNLKEYIDGRVVETYEQMDGLSNGW